ncbi:hypothetical protein TTHERM_00185240 (macronuclear) [Tetrahymena thermophila SB210]|uniref:Uncharacterized protein n=1 Tax=Tetrahymena thermophila (strain SB210) TaxID=312017 RepID=Q22T88_TETTS|nr:hypothetical protein TTHERM_00185240 [Tetrahymena thermophila SB210]EAR88550.2 hypothetical protein TTHERM_00185240 [Tetrahymena thermophila SB210]|eukprot:XP_001008795.2 hypothetical protein TTHERM_00185240 [Tetrahymena thermophila SB210]
MEALNKNSVMSQLCNKHNSNYIYLENEQTSQENPLACSQCYLENREKQYIIIQKVINSDNKKPVMNWPKGFTNQAYQFLDSQQKDKKVELKQKIIDFYQQLERQIQSELELSKQQQIKQLDEYFLDFSEMQNFYYEYFRLKQLKELMAYDDKLITQQYQRLLRQLNNQNNNNTTIETCLQYLYRSIEMYKDIDKQIIFEFEKVQQDLKKAVQEIRILPQMSQHFQKPQLLSQNIGLSQYNQQLQEVQYFPQSQISNKIKQNEILKKAQQSQIEQNQINQSSYQNNQRLMNTSKTNKLPIPFYPNIIAPSEIGIIFSQEIKDQMSQNNSINFLRFKNEFFQEKLTKLIIEPIDMSYNQKLNYSYFLNKLQNMSKDVFNIYNSNNEQQLAQQIVIYINKNLHNEINQILLSKNSKLVEKWVPLISLYQKSLCIYSDIQLKNNQQQTNKHLYRPALIPEYHFNQLIQINNNICFTSFQTFVSYSSIAIQYILNQKQSNENINVIFEYKPEINYSSAQRIIQINQEFITQPIIVYKIIDIKKFTLNNKIFYEVQIQKNEH